MPRYLGWFCLSFVIIVFDFLTKMAVLGSLAPGEARAIAPFFNLVLVFNKGAAFSFLAGAKGWQTLFFAGIAIVASVVISFLIVKNQNKSWFCAALALILGGALGNLYDRLVYGQVVDFLDFHFSGAHWPAFNIADSGITIGAAILIVESFFKNNPNEKQS